jgi:two-component system, LytTR family, response regulator
MKIRALVADDQPLARDRLAALLSEEPDIEVVGTAASGPEAVAAVQRLSPDLLLLDVQMPEMDGIAVVEAIGPARMPATVFVTAYDEYAVRAFELNAVDYLLKPFGRARLQQTVARVRQRLLGRRAEDLAARLAKVVDELRRPEHESERLIIRTEGRVTFVEIDRIDWIEAEGNYVRIHAGSETHLMRETLASLHSRLGDATFFRIHRSRVVNLARVHELTIGAGGDYAVVLTTGATLGLSRLYKEALQARLAGTLEP